MAISIGMIGGEYSIQMFSTPFTLQLNDGCTTRSLSSVSGRASRIAYCVMKVIEIADVLRNRLPAEHTRKVPRRVMPNWLVHVLSLFNPGVASIKNELGKTRHVDASHAHERLGWQTRPEEDSIVDCAKSLIAHGVVKV